MTHTQRGSGLLFTVLTLAIFTTLSLVLIKSFVSSARSASRLGASESAYSAAEQGLAEGRLWITNNPTREARAMYRPLSGETCSDFGVLQTTQPDSSCPSYQYSVVKNVSLSSLTSSTTKIQYQIPAPVFDRETGGAVITITPSPSGSVIALSLSENGTVAQNASIQFSCQNCNLPNPPLIAPTTRRIITSQNGSNPMVLTFTKLGTLPAASVVIKPNASASVAKGFTTVAATGYAGGVTRRRFISIYPTDASLYEYESSDELDSNGCLANYNGSDGTQTSTCFTQRSNGTP